MYEPTNLIILLIMDGLWFFLNYETHFLVHFLPTSDGIGRFQAIFLDNVYLRFIHFVKNDEGIHTGAENP
jgi:hypothetical protein